MARFDLFGVALIDGDATMARASGFGHGERRTTGEGESREQVCESRERVGLGGALNHKGGVRQRAS